MYHRNGNLYNLSRSQHRIAKHSSKSKNVSPTSTFTLILFNTFSPSKESLLTKEETRVRERECDPTRRGGRGGNLPLEIFKIRVFQNAFVRFKGSMMQKQAAKSEV